MDGNCLVLIRPDGSRERVDVIQGLTVEFRGRESTIEIGEGSAFRNAKIVMGTDCRVEIGVTHPRGLINTSIDLSGTGEGKFLSIGRGASIESARFAMGGAQRTEIRIGDNCLIGSNVIFRANDGPPLFDLSANQVVDYPQPIVIGDHVWVGAGVTFLKGSQIANETVVATHSVVSRHFREDNTVIAGNPANVVKRNVGRDRAHLKDNVGDLREVAPSTDLVADETNQPVLQKELEAELTGLLKPRVGITGSLARGNYGDELFVRVYERWLGQWADLTLLTSVFRPRYFREIRNTQVDLMDAVVLGGGDLLLPCHSWIDPDFINPMYLRRPVHVVGIGVENKLPDFLPDVVSQWKSFLTHPSVRSISTRDEGSAAWISNHIQPEVEVSSHADLVCALPLPEVSRPEGAPILGIVTRYVRDPSDYEQLAEIGRRLLEQGWRVRHIIGGVAAHGQRDFENAEHLKIEGKETVYTEDLDLITRSLGECTLLLSMKLHTTLVATMYGVPTICVHPVVKTTAFMKAIGREELLVEPMDPRLWTLIVDGVPEVPMDKVEMLRADAIEHLRILSQRIWDDYRNESAVRQRLLPASPTWN